MGMKINISSIISVLISISVSAIMQFSPIMWQQTCT